MAEIIKKIANAGKIYSIGGGSTPVEEVEHKVVTQEEFDVIPQEEKVKNVYMIKGEAEPTPTPGGGTIIERGDMLLHTIQKYSDSNSFYDWPDNEMSAVTFYDNLWNEVYKYYHINWSEWPYTIHWGNLYISRYTSWTWYNYSINLVNVEDWSESNIYTIPADSSTARDIKFVDYMYVKAKPDFWASELSYYKVDYEGNVETSTQSEFDAIPSGAYYKWLFYTQDWNDYVAKTKEWTEVKRYSGVGTISGIYNDKLYRNIGDVSYAIASIPTT